MTNRCDEKRLEFRFSFLWPAHKSPTVGNGDSSEEALKKEQEEKTPASEFRGCASHHNEGYLDIMFVVTCTTSAHIVNTPAVKC